MTLDDDRDEPVSDPIRSGDEYRYESTSWALPTDLAAALSRNPRARQAFDALPDQSQREHVQRLLAFQDAAHRSYFLAQILTELEKGPGYPG
jgi:uncharacterized protein YdeI (YjbR/CyaY-like superfamily)